MSDIYDTKFGGRTLLVTCVFKTLLTPTELSQRVLAMASGPLERMTCGSLGKSPLGYVTKTFINTDEPEVEVGARAWRMKPSPEAVTIGIVDPVDGARIWEMLRNSAVEPGKYHVQEVDLEAHREKPN